MASSVKFQQPEVCVMSPWAAVAGSFLQCLNVFLIFASASIFHASRKKA